MEKTVYEKLMEEFGAAIFACYGDVADATFTENEVSKSDIEKIAKKVIFYLDL